MYRQDAAPDRSLLVVAFNGRVFAVDRATGVIRWETSELPGGETHVRIFDDVVVVSMIGGVALLSYETGAFLARIRVESELVAARPSVLVEGGYVYVGNDGIVACYTLRGEKLWEQPFRGKGHGRVALAVPGENASFDDASAR